MEPTKTVLYARFSSLGQKQGTSIQRQLEYGTAFCQQHGWQVDGQITDEGKSAFHGTHRTRGNLGLFEQDALLGIEAGTRLVCENLDRLSRGEPEDSYDFIRSLTRNGVTICTYQDGETYHAGKLDMLKILKLLLTFQRANEESAAKSARSKANWAIKHQNAVTSGQAVSKRCKPWLKVVNGQYVLDTDRQPLLLRIFTMADSGEGSLNIVQTLNSEKVPVWGKATCWHRSAIIGLLTDRAVVGEKIINGQVVKLYPPAVPADLFERVCANATSRKTGSVGLGSEKVNNLLSGLCKCDECNGRMEYTGAGQLRCRSNLVHTGCTNDVRVNYPKLEKAVLDSCLHLALDDNAFTNKAEVARLNVTIAERTRDLQAAQDKARSLMDLYTTQQSKLAMDMALEAEKRAGEIAKNLEALKAQRETAKGRASNLEHMKRITDMRAHLATDVTLRKRVAQGLQSLITAAFFEADGRVTLHLSGGLGAVRILNGEVEAQVAYPEMFGNVTKLERLSYAGQRDRKAAPAVLKRLKSA